MCRKLSFQTGAVAGDRVLRAGRGILAGASIPFRLSRGDSTGQGACPLLPCGRPRLAHPGQTWPRNPRPGSPANRAQRPRSAGATGKVPPLWKFGAPVRRMRLIFPLPYSSPGSPAAQKRQGPEGIRAENSAKKANLIKNSPDSKFFPETVYNDRLSPPIPVRDRHFR